MRTLFFKFPEGEERYVLPQWCRILLYVLNAWTAAILALFICHGIRHEWQPSRLISGLLSATAGIWLFSLTCLLMIGLCRKGRHFWNHYDEDKKGDVR